MSPVLRRVVATLLSVSSQAEEDGLVEVAATAGLVMDVLVAGCEVTPPVDLDEAVEVPISLSGVARALDVGDGDGLEDGEAQLLLLAGIELRDQVAFLDDLEVLDPGEAR